MYDRISSSLVRLASRSKAYHYKHAACVYSGKRVIGVGVNEPTYFINSNHYITGRHAEIVAIRNAMLNLKRRGKRLRSFKIIVVRSNELNAMPCVACRSLLSRMNCKRVIANDGTGVSSVKAAGVPHHECSSVTIRRARIADSDSGSGKL
uniref:CMP/dCMP-type deaminase domain-containing protein n=1 Tax=viral metagenome TaxID=1070528 RepID=A0A6C0M1C0_9ZZZZ